MHFTLALALLATTLGQATPVAEEAPSAMEVPVAMEARSDVTDTLLNAAAAGANGCHCVAGLVGSHTQAATQVGNGLPQLGLRSPHGPPNHIMRVQAMRGKSEPDGR
ncbi:hypothetical protein C8A00DRAFT_36589 [Chaetomidium leptoderma]|uniref:Uncharacterized protein n=1 Tax=Chaetomidium leptoderma TaxID=669021 RepID=A0AAN6ZVW5_9PEZI|nr:hypothetical protein C8A00DRAFT_36589 [Chaetomidium leptoderma]